jgi:hypothetical protein
MRKSWLWENADKLATVATAIAAVVALLYAHLQITEGRRAERAANANELWRETLRLGFDNAKLSDPSLKLADFDYDKLTIDGSRELFQQYEIYVDTVLNASDEILEISPTQDWKTSLRIQLLPHRDYLLSPHFKQSGYLDQYGKTLRSFLDEVLNEPGAPASERRSGDTRAAKRRLAANPASYTGHYLKQVLARCPSSKAASGKPRPAETQAAE